MPPDGSPKAAVTDESASDMTEWSCSPLWYLSHSSLPPDDQPVWCGGPSVHSQSPEVGFPSVVVNFGDHVYCIMDKVAMNGPSKGTLGVGHPILLPI